MNKICLIRQSGGIGDIFFCQKIAKTYLSRGYRVIWPIKDIFSWLKSYIPSAIEYPLLSEDFPFKELYLDLSKKFIINNDELLFLPIDGHNLLDASVMVSKYKFVKINYVDWLDYFSFSRNVDKENELYYNVLKLSDNEDYCFYNQMFASPPEIQLIKEPKLPNKRIVKLEMLKDFTLFDWAKVVENASSIYTAETSLNYIIEKINTTSDLHMYSKWYPIDFHHIKPLFKKPWTYEFPNN